MGLNYDFNNFVVEIKNSPEPIAKINLQILDKNLQSTNWSLFSLNIDSNYAAALAINENANSANIKFFSC
jgi:hypothetical protein